MIRLIQQVCLVMMYTLEGKQCHQTRDLKQPDT